ncbi:MAG: hypothetical protein MHM6MM_004379 [Cercozoa sp. M6MM]
MYSLECEVTAISRTEAKKQLCLTRLGADHFVAMSDEAQVKSAAASLDLLLFTADGNNMDYLPYMDMLDTDGVLVMLGVPDHAVRPMVILAYSTTQFNPYLPPVRSDVNAATEHMHNGKVRFRMVLENDFAQN